MGSNWPTSAPTARGGESNLILPQTPSPNGTLFATSVHLSLATGFSSSFLRPDTVQATYTIPALCHLEQALPDSPRPSSGLRNLPRVQDRGTVSAPSDRILPVIHRFPRDSGCELRLLASFDWRFAYVLRANLPLQVQRLLALLQQA